MPTRPPLKYTEQKKTDIHNTEADYTALLCYTENLKGL